MERSTPRVSERLVGTLCLSLSLSSSLSSSLFDKSSQCSFLQLILPSPFLLRSQYPFLSFYLFQYQLSTILEIFSLFNFSLKLFNLVKSSAFRYTYSSTLFIFHSPITAAGSGEPLGLFVFHFLCSFQNFASFQISRFPHFSIKRRKVFWLFFKGNIFAKKDFFLERNENRNFEKSLKFIFLASF